MQRQIEKIKNIRRLLFSTGFFHVFGSNVLNQMIAFLSGLLLVRILSKTEYGVYSYAYSIANMFLILNGLGVCSALLQVCSETSEKKFQKSCYGYSNCIGIPFDLLLGILLAIVSLTVPFKVKGTAQVLIFMSLLPLGMLMFQIKTIYMRATLRMKEFSYANSGNALLIFLFSVTGAFLFGAKGLVTGQTLAYFITSGIIALTLRLPIRFNAEGLTPKNKKDFMKISVISSATSGMSQLMNLLDIFILGIIIPQENVIASYKVATTIPLALTFISTAIITYVYPYFAKNKDNKQWLQINYKRLMLVVAGINGTIALLLIVLSPVIIRLVFGRQYLDALIPFCILSLDFFFSCTFSGISGNLLTTQRKLNFNFWRNTIMGVLNTIGNIVFISLWGSTGAAISTFSVGLAGGIAATWKMTVTIKQIDQKTKSTI